MSDNPAVATVPDSIVVQGGQTTATFPVTTVPVAQFVTVTIHAAPTGVNLTVPLTVVPPVLDRITLLLTTVLTAQTVPGRVSLNGPAPPGGFVVTLTSTNPAVVLVPPSAAVLGGNTTANFGATVPSIPPVTQTTSVTISASAGAVTKTIQLTVLHIVPVSLSLTLSPDSTVGGRSPTGQLSVTGGVPTGGSHVVALSSSNPVVAAVPASDTVPAGQTAGFLVATVPVAQPTLIVITAATSGVSKTARLTVLPPVPSSVTLAATSVRAGQSSTGQVRLNGPAPSGGLTVGLSSSNPALVVVPQSVTVQAGHPGASFGFGALFVTQSTTITITATAGGVSKTAQLTVTP